MKSGQFFAESVRIFACFFEIIAASRVIALHSNGGRKVRTAQSNAPVKSRAPTCRGQTVPQKITSSLSLLHSVEKGRMEG